MFPTIADHCMPYDLSNRSKYSVQTSNLRATQEKVKYKLNRISSPISNNHFPHLRSWHLSVTNTLTPFMNKKKKKRDHRTGTKVLHSEKVILLSLAATAEACWSFSDLLTAYGLGRAGGFLGAERGL